jgi:hypothetical protein
VLSKHQLEHITEHSESTHLQFEDSTFAIAAVSFHREQHLDVGL